MKERLLEFLAYLGVGQTKFEGMVGLSRGMINKIRGDMSIKSLGRIASAFPELNINWLQTGEGEMLRSANVQNFGDINDNSGFVGMAGGDVHNNAGRDRTANEQKKQLDVLIGEVQRFNDQLERKDVCIKEMVGIIDRQNQKMLEYSDRMLSLLEKNLTPSK